MQRKRRLTRISDLVLNTDSLGVIQTESVGKSSSPVWLYSVLPLLPCLAALAAHFISRDALLLVYFLAALATFAVLLRLQQPFADRFFPLLVGSVALSLLLTSTLISENISGYDIHQEFALFQQVLQQGVWHSDISLLYNSALSVTILPSIISILSSLDGTLVFKIIFPFLFSIVPVILYKIYRNILTPKAALVSVFVFLSYPSSYGEITQLGRQMIAELIMVLLLWLLFSGSLGKARWSIPVVVTLAFGLVVSHYALAVIYAFLVGFSYAMSLILRHRNEALATVSLVVLSIVASLCWFIFVAGGVVFEKAALFSSIVVQGLKDFLNPASRPPVLADALGLTSVTPGFLHIVSRGTQYLVLFCILLGFLIFIRKRTKNSAAILMTPSIMASMGLILASVALPYASTVLNLSRIYSIVLLFISPCFALGAAKITAGLQWLCNLLARNRLRLRMGMSVPAAILFLYLLFTSGWLWAVTSDTPISDVLDLGRMRQSPNPKISTQYYGEYTLQEDVAATHWMRSYTIALHPICADWISHYHVLLSYGGYDAMSGSSIPYCRLYREYIYVSVMNSNTGFGTVALQGNLLQMPLNTILGQFVDSENRVYSDGAAVYEGFS